MPPRFGGIAIPSTPEDVNALVAARVQENLHLDYKDERSLERSEKSKTELSKDVAAFANSDGGVIVYGVTEDPQDRSYPSHVTGCTRADITAEWIEQVVQSRITPRIDGLRISTIQITDGGRVFCLGVPKSTTVHQSSDHMYYKRNNLRSVPMEHYEVLDVLGRRSSPNLWIRLTFSNGQPRQAVDATRKVKLKAAVENRGDAVVLYALLLIGIDARLQARSPSPSLHRTGTNEDQPVVGSTSTTFHCKIIVPSSMPIWRGQIWDLGEVEVTIPLPTQPLELFPVEWSASAPDMPSRTGQYILAVRDGTVALAEHVATTEG